MATVYDNIKENREVHAEDIEQAITDYLVAQGVYTADEIDRLNFGMQYYDEKYGWTTTKCLKIRLT